MRVAICVIAIGERYIEEYNRLFMRSHKAYAERHGYDFKVITSYLSELTHPDAISFNKLLVCSQDWSTSYDYIAVIDADILINPRAPALPFHLLGDKVGMVDEYSQPTSERRILVQRRNGWEDSATKYHSLCGYQFDTSHVFNTGLMVFQPTKHKTLCKSIFADYAHKNIGHPRGFHFEQTTTNYELQRRGMISTLPNEFNAVLAVAMSDNPRLTISEFFSSNYFVHFAGHYGYEWVEAYHSTQFVIARYKEPVDWVWKGSHDVVVYNKSGVDEIGMISLPNVGREAHTYIHHIVKNYDTLANVTVFLQARISDHGYMEDIDHLARQLGTSARDRGYSNNFHTVHSDHDFNIKMRDLLVSQYGVPAESVVKIQFSDWFTQFILPIYPVPTSWYGNALFAVSKDKIRTRPKEFYERLLSELSTDNAPIEAHFLERSWFYVFNNHVC